MSTTAHAIIEAALGDLGVLAAEQGMDAAMATDGLLRLNNMISGWQIQNGTTIAVVRQLFNLVEDKQTYTIGLGGNFNVPRPTSIAGAGLLLNGLTSAVSVTSITRSGYVANVTQTAHPFVVGDEAYISGATQIDYNGLQTVQSVPTANTYTFTVQGTPVTPATGTITAAEIDGQPVEIPRDVITNSAYQSLALKNLPNSLFTGVYYNPTFPFGTIYVWPRVDTDANQLVLYLPNVFTSFADLSTDYDWPSVPGYAEALQYQLALRLSVPYKMPASDELHMLARETFGLIKRANNRLNDVANDAAILSSRRGGYDINSDEVR